MSLLLALACLYAPIRVQRHAAPANHPKVAAPSPTRPAVQNTPPTQAQLDAITNRGRSLAQYDVAAAFASDAVQARSPKPGSVNRYIARQTPTGWVVAFGRLNDQNDKFMTAAEAVQSASPKEFTAQTLDLPREDTIFTLFAARALALATSDFRGQRRPYNAAVLPAPAGKFWVYIYPAQTENSVYPLGGDARYLVSADGTKILTKRTLHNTILEYKTPADTEKNEPPVAGMHSAVVDNLPEDTDVFYVLVRKPSLPEYIVTQKFMYRIETEGTIRYLGTIQHPVKKANAK